MKYFFCGFLIFAFMFQIQGQASSVSKKPNIVFLFADDWGYYASCFANKDVPSVNDVVNTPIIDQLALEGVRFDNAFVEVPSCTPSRASIATGAHFWRCGKNANLRGGAWEGVHDPGDDLPGFGNILNKNGYHTGRTYKTLWDKWFAGEVYMANGSKFNHYSQTVDTAQTIEAGHQELKKEVLANFHDFLDDRKKGQPFCYVWGPHNTHRPWVQGSGKKIWEINPDDLKGKMPKYMPDVPVVREDFADYLGEVQAFDLGVGYIIDELKRLGEYENTIIVLSGDNGIPGFPRGKSNIYDLGVKAPLIVRWGEIQTSNRIISDFVSLIDLAPTFLEAAGLDIPKTVDGKSLMPLLLSNKSGQIDKNRNSVVVGRERHLDNARDGNLPYPSRAIYTKDYLYIRNFKPDRMPLGKEFDDEEKPFNYLRGNTNSSFSDMDNSPTKAFIIDNRDNPEYAQYFTYAFEKRPLEELYDLRNDPDQLVNLADSKKSAKVKKQLLSQLMKVLKDSNDPRLTNEFDYPPYIEQLD